MPAETAPAAAPAAKTPAAPPPTPSGKAPQPFDVRMALAKNLGTPRGEAAPAPAATTAADGNIDADPDADAAVDPGDAADPPEPAADPDAPDADGDAAADGAEPTTAEAQLEAVTKAFESGDIEAMAAALSKPGVKISGPVKRAFRAYQHRVRKADERERKANERDQSFEAARARAQQEIAEDSRRVSSQERGLIQKYGWAHSLAEAWEKQDALGVAKALEKGCKGASLATITQVLASGKTGLTPEEQRLLEDRKKLDAEREAENRKKAEAEEKKASAIKREAALTRVGESLKDHPYLQTTNDKGDKVIDQEALSEVFDLAEASWNGEKFTKTPRKVADELQEKLLTRAKARGLTVAAPAASTKGKPAPTATRRPAARPGLREPPRTPSTTRGTPQDLEQTRANRLAQARRLTEMQRRGVR